MPPHRTAVWNFSITSRRQVLLCAPQTVARQPSWDPSQPTLIVLRPCSSPRKGTPVMNRPMCRIVVSAVGAAALLGFAGVGAGAAPRRVTEVLLPTRRQASSSNVHDSISSPGVHSRRTSTPVAQIPPMVAAPYDLARTPYFGAGVSYGSAWPSRHGTSLSSARPAHHRRLISRATSTAISPAQCERGQSTELPHPLLRHPRHPPGTYRGV
jgi:hypothetical protein